MDPTSPDDDDDLLLVIRTEYLDDGAWERFKTGLLAAWVTAGPSGDAGGFGFKFWEDDPQVGGFEGQGAHAVRQTLIGRYRQQQQQVEKKEAHAADGSSAAAFVLPDPLTGTKTFEYCFFILADAETLRGDGSVAVVHISVADDEGLEGQGEPDLTRLLQRCKELREPPRPSEDPPSGEEGGGELAALSPEAGSLLSDDERVSFRCRIGVPLCIVACNLSIFNVDFEDYWIPSGGRAFDMEW